MKNQTKHFMNCNAPLCAEDKSPQALWYAGEEVCSKRPLTDLQKKQLRINKGYLKGRFQDRVWTQAELLKVRL